MVSRAQDNQAHYQNLVFDGMRWQMDTKQLVDCFVADPVTVFKFLPKS